MLVPLQRMEPVDMLNNITAITLMFLCLLYFLGFIVFACLHSHHVGVRQKQQ